MDRARVAPCEIETELGPLPDAAPSFGLAFDGERLWVAAGEVMHAMMPDTGEITASLPIACDAGTAFDGRHLYQLAGDRIRKIDRESGDVVSTISAPGDDGDDAGLAWAEGRLWVGQHRGRRIHEIDPSTGAVLKTLESDRYITGVTWAQGELWHATYEDERSQLRRIDPGDGRVLTKADVPEGVMVTGLTALGGGRFACGEGEKGRVRVIRIQE